jgi:hypothetical protein
MVNQDRVHSHLLMVLQIIISFQFIIMAIQIGPNGLLPMQLNRWVRDRLLLNLMRHLYLFLYKRLRDIMELQKMT